MKNLLFLLLLGFILSSCGERVINAKQKSNCVSYNTILNNYNRWVTLCKLDNGLICIFTSDGVTCDWSRDWAGYLKRKL